MALARRGSRSAHDAPPPSPIPTGRGSRSAANNTFIQYLETSIQLPRLSLPPSHFPSDTTRPVHSDVDFRSLLIDNDDGDSVSRILSSTEKLGAFRIINHGISFDRLSSLLKESEGLFNDTVIGPDFVKRYEDREEIVWFRSRTERMRLTETFIAGQNYRTFRQNMDYVANKLEAIADLITGVIVESLGEKFQAKIKDRESTLIICRYNHDSCKRGNERKTKEKEEEEEEVRDDALSLHIPLQHCQFHAESDENPLYFNGGSDVVIVTIGKQLREWSLGRFKSTSGELFYEAGNHGSQASASSSSSIKLKFSLTRFKTISIVDQILFGFIICFFYQIFALVSSRLTGT